MRETSTSRPKMGPVAKRQQSVPIGTSVVIGTGRGILLKHNRTLLEEYGGTVTLDKEWAKSVLRRMGYTKRRANSKSRVLPSDFIKIKEDFLLNIKAVVEIEDIPEFLIINWDQTSM